MRVWVEEIVVDVVVVARPLSIFSRIKPIYFNKLCLHVVIVIVIINTFGVIENIR